ncbi:metal ABC transporter ATP-binding protein [Bifidobacterium tibiigranuli]|jgi:zinc/manganese transport system ATP-binding protein|uniref:metal ABC transporter ATP-binding protein n=1 Tax=Bifidobacterium tibiigranuli TaxID=2172043 RepID=UPI0026F278C2|nr:metal ABC transporter ATP-binding protein [Bifidobacterium tibiigranuli]MCI1650307.1 metal ABC transporter ATP-binding protein [Bifidobacterium tibiigranuli]MCI2184953.1 metal ABC transporter ATP-binding protein [Bifidobacterium tibiigranuli]MCI2204899.1 metal ABC transporter ATP-binding protein [Bifidobacterium tibiigranuli]
MKPTDDINRPLLNVSGLRVNLGGRSILDGIDLTVGRGEFVGLIGSNGAGKTTLLKTILGDTTPLEGSVTVLGRKRLQTGVIGYVPQKIELDPDLPLLAKDFVALGLDGQKFGISLRGKHFWERVNIALKGVGALEYADRPVGRLSGGQQQRIMIAAAIVADPALLLLDEPLANLDPANSADIVALLDHIRSTKGIGIILSAHDINPLLGVLDRVVYLAQGRSAVGRTDEVVRTDVLSELYQHPITVLRTQGRIVVLADEGSEPGHHPDNAENPEDAEGIEGTGRAGYNNETGRIADALGPNASQESQLPQTSQSPQEDGSHDDRR